MPVSRLDPRRIERAKAAFSTRRVAKSDMSHLVTGDVRPFPGDVVLARVEELGKQTKLELANGRRAHMFPGDEIIVVYGNRYAPDQYEAVVGIDLSPCDLVAAGGLAAVELARHHRMIMPTRIAPVGLLADRHGKRLNLKDHKVAASVQRPKIPAILSLGTSMNAGKSLTAASLVRGFKRLGHKVAALKITGTGSGGDLWIVSDAGADVVADFTDAGFPSTYMTSIHELEEATYRLMNHSANEGCEIAVIEIADGLQQLETSALIRSQAIQDVTLATVFAAFDSMGAMCGVEALRDADHDLVALSGRIGLSPLGVREAEYATGMKYYSPWDIQDGILVPIIRQRAAAKLAANPAGMEEALKSLARDLVNPASHPAVETASEIDSRDEAASQVMHLVADFVVQQDFNRLYQSLGDRPARQRTKKYDHRIWQSGLGLIHLRVPRTARGKFKPRFLDKQISPEIVHAVVESIGTPRCDSALLRLVYLLGGPDYDRVDLRPLRERVETLCIDCGVEMGEAEDRPSLTIDELEPIVPGAATATTEFEFAMIRHDVLTAANIPSVAQLEETEPALPAKRRDVGKG